MTIMRKIYTYITLTLLICCGYIGNTFAQFPWSSGFETAQPLFTYSSTTNTAALLTGIARTGTKNGGMTAGGTYDASIITPSFTFVGCKQYTINVYARAVACTGLLQIMKSATATNAAMKAATGSDILLTSGSNNVTSTTYTLYSATFIPTVTETKYIGFQMQGTGGGPCGSINMYIDDITITEVTPGAPVGGTATASPTSVGCSGSSTITLTGSTGFIQWQQSTDGGATWFNIIGATATTLATGALTITTQFRAVLTGYSGGCATANSTVATVTCTGGASKTWLTGGTTAWGTAANWSPSGVPTACTDVTIPSGGTQPTISAAANCRNLTVNAGAVLTNGSSLNIYGNLTNNGNISDAAGAFYYPENLYGKNNTWGGTGTYLNGATQVGNIRPKDGANYTVTGNQTIRWLGDNLAEYTGSVSLGSYTVTIGSGQDGVLYNLFYLNYNTGMIDLKGGGGINTAKSNYGTGTLFVHSNLNNFGFNLEDDYYNVWFENAGGTTKFGKAAIDVYIKQDIWIRSPCILDLSASGSNAIVVGHDFINDDVMTAATSFIRMEDFNVAQVQNIRSTNGTITTFNGLEINNSGPGVYLQLNSGTNATSTGVLRMTAGPLYLNSFRFTVQNPALGGITRTGGRVVSENNVAVNPSILQWNIGATTGAHIFPFGTSGAGGSYIPVTFNNSGAVGNISISTRPTAASDNLPWTTGVTTMNDINGLPGAVPSTIDRWWEITSSLVSPIPASTLSLSYLGAENTMTPTTDVLGIQHWNGSASVWDNGNNGGAGTYVTTGTPGSTTAGPKTVTGSGGITYFSPFVLSRITAPLAPLPVELLSFTAVCKDAQVIAEWSTASEFNNKYFNLEKSFDGINFYSVAIVDGAGNSSTIKKYSAVDADPCKGTCYYRLRQTDYNGQTQTFNPVAVAGCGNKDGFAVYPNPASGTFNVTLSAKQGDQVLIVVRDLLGQEFYSQVFLLSNDTETIAIDPSGKLSAGVYFVVAASDDAIYRKKLVIK